MKHKHKITNLDELGKLGFTKTEVFTGSFGEMQVYQKNHEAILYDATRDRILLNFQPNPATLRIIYRRRL